MNERIQELAEQAWDNTAVSPDFGHPVSFAEKFAELIVKECVNVLHKAQRDKGEVWVCADGTRIMPHIKEHFGVQ